MIDEKIVKQILEEVFCSVEDVEAQSAAILQFLKEKGMANDKELAPYLEQAKTSSGVRWVAIRARVDYLLSSIIYNEEKESAAYSGEFGRLQREGAHIGDVLDRRGRTGSALLLQPTLRSESFLLTTRKSSRCWRA